MVMGYTYNWFDLFLFKQKTAYEMRISDWSSDGALPIYGRQPRPAAGHRVHGACVERATTGGAGVLVRTGNAGAQAAAVPAIRHAVNDGGGGAARRVLAVLSGLDLDPGDTTVVASGPADVAGDVDGVIAGGRNRLPAPTIPCIDAGRSHGDAARPALHAGDTGPVAGRCR